MSVIFVVVPLATLVVLVAVVAFVVSAQRGQFDDLDTPPVRMLYDDAPNTDDRSPVVNPPTPRQAPSERP